MSMFLNIDCMAALPWFPDNHFDLAIVDPPYGDGNGGGSDRPIRNTGKPVREVQIPRGGVSRKEQILPRTVCRTGGSWAAKYGKKIIAWDTSPDEEYFKELFRVSRKQIVWGGNYFNLPPTRNFIVWRKSNIPEKFTMAMCEYAWTNIKGNAKEFSCTSQRTKESGKFHPTEKPLKLYRWLLENYAEEGDKILDTHVGTGNSLIACEEQGFEYIGFEIDKLYYEKANEHIHKHREERLRKAFTL